MTAFDEREEHLRQRAERRWTDDEDVAVCIEEIDRLRAELDEAEKTIDFWSDGQDREMAS